MTLFFQPFAPISPKPSQGDCVRYLSAYPCASEHVERAESRPSLKVATAR